ncbi:MAG: FAD-dependent oxidoreductase [bacterium]
MQEHLVIIGGGAAGAKAAAKARKQDTDLKISLYDKNYYISYSACGLTYYIENIIDDYHRLLARSSEKFKEENIDIYTKHEVINILPNEHKIIVKNIENNTEFQVEYTKLLIATGTRAFIPKLDRSNFKNVFILRTIDDGIAIKNQILTSKKAVIIGAGFIGIEAAEAFYNRGLEVIIIEASSQILSSFDKDIAFQVQEYLEKEKSIKIITNDRVKKLISDNNEVKQIETNSGKIIDADTLLLAVGVKPNSELAESAGIQLGKTKAIKVNERMQTNIEDIYAAGDCVEQTNIITQKSTWIPLGSTSNKQGRIAALNITGKNAKFKGVLGTLALKVFNYAITKTGLSEKEAEENKYNYEISTITLKDRAGYYPGVENITIKLMADKLTKKLLGAQIIGKGDADKRINILAAALTANMTVDELLDVDLSYTPAYSTTIDPVLIAARILQKKIKNI